MAITLGPIVGHTTDSSAKIWMRGEKLPDAAPATYCYGAVDLYANGSRVASKYCNLKDYYDFTGLVNFDGLTPDTLYRVHCDTAYFTDDKAPKVGALQPQAIAGPSGVSSEFRTGRAPDDGRLSFVFGSCRYLYWDNVFHSDTAKGDKTFRSILAQHKTSALDLVLMIGDQVYADPLNRFREYSSAEELFKVYRESFGQTHIRDLMGRVPTYMILDDHEISNDWSRDQMLGGKQGYFAHAMRAYTSYQHLHNPDTREGQYWYSFRQGAFPFFVMDTRTRRIVEGSAVEPRTMLGREQLNDLFDWLHQHRKAPKKFVVSSVPFFPDPKSSQDKWSGFPEERSLILEFIRVERIRNIVFLSGDVHNTNFSRMRCHQDPSFQLTSLVSSPFYWPYPHESSSNFYGGRTIEYLQWLDASRRERDRIEYRYEGEGFIGSENFVRVNVDLSLGTKPGRAEIFGRKGERFKDYAGAFVF